jgi:primosomal protein N''
MLAKLEAVCEAVRGRFEQNGQQPDDRLRHRRVQETLRELQDETEVDISDSGIQFLWEKLLGQIDTIGTLPVSLKK